ncbi:hypothetical protein B0J11DRAFT_569474 [Dendryphion nanum]|uniref:Uncharacterized protein n=1 Tax=Dendryphion nanum TaxID=256645 RepID=A0A9P9DPL8_9PLEO|nr:hypothetical protein B0J11DRAFT_569474 [Dendryphion nanum]
MYTTSTKRRRPEDDDDQNSPSPYRHNKRPRNPASHFRPFSFPPRLPANAGMPPQTAIPPRQRSLYTQNTRTMRPLGVFYHPDPRARAPPDSHQDDIVVNSVEFDEGEKFTGVADYVHQLQEHETRQSPYITIRTEPDHNILPTDDLERDIPPSTTHLLPNVDYTRYPRIAHRNKATLIYSGSTYNPLIPLAIIRIAEKNMPFFNLLSAKNHIPNIHPSTPYPRIPPNPGFLDDIQWYSDRTFFSTLPPIRDSSDSSSPSANNTPPNPETSQGKSHPFPHPHTPSS